MSLFLLKQKMKIGLPTIVYNDPIVAIFLTTSEDSTTLPTKQNANIQSRSAGNVIGIIDCRIEKIIGLGGQVNMRSEFVFQTYLWRNNHGAVNLVNGYIGIII